MTDQADRIRLARERALRVAEGAGDEEAAKRLRAALKPKPEVAEPSMSNTKAELLEAAQAAGLDIDESNTKAEILEALGG